MTKPLFCIAPAPEGAVVCRGCGRVMPVVRYGDGTFRVILHLSSGGKSMCLGGEIEVKKEDVQRAYWIE